MSGPQEAVGKGDISGREHTLCNGIRAVLRARRRRWPSRIPDLANTKKQVNQMPGLEHEPVPAIAPERFWSLLSCGEYEALLDLISHAVRELHGRVIWNVNSTAKGGGVVEMLRPLLGYCRGAGVDARWVVISGEPEFFAITKRLHNRLHGFAGDGGPLGAVEREVYEGTLAGSAEERSWGWSVRGIS